MIKSILMASALMATPAMAQGFRVPEYYNGCGPAPNVKVVEMPVTKVDAFCRKLGVTTPYTMAGCYDQNTRTIVLPSDVSAGWRAEYRKHEIAHSWGWSDGHPYFNSKRRLCK